MKKIITILFFVLLYYTGYSQTWQEIPNFGGAARARSGSFSIGDTGYIIAGGNSWYVPDAWGYDTLTQQWFQIAGYPGNDDDPISFSINGKGYCVTGGTCCPGYSNSLYEYDPYPSNTWTQLASIPGAARTFSVGFAIAGKLYVGGGVNDSAAPSNSNPLKDFWQYDPGTGTWTRIADCPALGVNEFACGFAINGKGYVGCGCQVIFGSSTGTPQKDFWEYDPGTDTWTQKNNFPGGPLAGASAYATCDKGYICCGFTDDNLSVFTNAFWQYDPVKDVWTQLVSYEGVPRLFTSAFVIGNTGFVGDGGDPNAVLPDFYEFHADYIPTFITNEGDSAVTICAGQSLTFTDSSNYTPTNWYWHFPGGIPDTSTAQNPTVEYDTTGVWTITFSAWNGCDSASVIDSNYVTVGVGGILTVLPQSPKVCNGQSVTLKLTDTTVGTFTWTPSAGLSTTTGDSAVATPLVTTTYTVTGTNPGGCLLTGTDTVKVDSAPALIILPQPPPLFCSGSSAELKVKGGGTNFIWTPITGLSDTTNSDSVLASPTVTTTYMVSGNDSLGCASTGTEKVTVFPAPITPTFTQLGDSLKSSAQYQNQWYLNDTLLVGDTSQYLAITVAGDYWVSVTNEANGCSSASDSASIKLAGINQVSAISDQVSIYPNPFNNTIVIKINSSAVDIKDWNLQIIDVLGRTVYSRSSLNYSNEIDLSNLAGGIYFITVINKTGRVVVPVVKEN